MTDTPPAIFDRAALIRHRKRAARDPALFLQTAAADEVHERLKEVNRTFTSPAVISAFPQVWRQFGPHFDDTDTLALTEATHDLVIHAMALHWVEDPVGQLIQCRRALKPDGLFIAVFFGGQTLTELRTALAAGEVATTGGISPRIAPMGEIRDLGALLQRAGFALPVADGFAQTVEYRDAFHLMADLRAMGETNALAGRLRHPTKRGVFARAAAEYETAYKLPNGRIPATFDTVFLTGWAPAPEQQQPMRPGSAATRLADALGVDEHKPNND